MAKVGIVMGSDSDMPVMAKAADILDKLGIDYEMTIISAHREPDVFFEYAKSAEAKGFKVIIAGEFKGCLELAKYFLDTVGLLENCTFRFSQWDPENKNNKYEGTKEQWEESQAVMKTILDDLDVDYEVGIDEAAFYGPKLDIQYKNVFGKEDTIVTIQIDMLLAERFGMYYIDKDGQKKLPYIIHRTSLGCFERTLAYMIERFAGVMPLWLAPEQIRLLPIKEGNVEYAQGIADRLTSLGMRVTVDSRDENIGPKIKAARLERIPYILVIGDNEMNSSTVTVRSRKRGEIPNMSVDEFVALVKNEVDTKEK